MIRIYFNPKICWNISDSETYVIVKDKKTGLICDAIKKKWFFWISKYPKPFYEPNGHWIIKGN